MTEEKKFAIGEKVIVNTEKEGYFIGEIDRYDYAESPLREPYPYLIEINDEEYGYVGAKEEIVQSYRCDCGRDKFYIDSKEEWKCIECD